MHKQLVSKQRVADHGEVLTAKRTHGGNKTDVSIIGQESNPTTWRLAHMNPAIRGIEANLGPAPADTFLRDQHPDLKADFILANPPFNVSDYSGALLRGDRRWAFGDSPARTGGEV